MTGTVGAGGGTVRAVAVVPSAPLLLPAVSPRQPAEVADAVATLRADVTAVLEGLPTVDAIVLLAAGDDATLPDGGHVDLAGSGHPHVVRDVPVDRELLAAMATGTASPRVRSDRLDGDLAVLAVAVNDVWPQVPVVPVAVATGAGAATLAGFAAGLADAVLANGRDVAIVAAGDLAATREVTSPGYLVEGATAFDDAMVAALSAGDVAALGALGPDEAGRVAARSWAPLVVLCHLAAGAGAVLHDLRLHVPRGVGQLVASSSPRRPADPRAAS